MRTPLTNEQVTILRDVNRFSSIKRYHGLLPEKLALLYDPQTLKSLQDVGFIEEGVIVSRCGSRLRGYRLTDICRAGVKEQGIDLDQGPVRIDGQSFLPEEELGPEQISILRDVYHFSQLSMNCGMTPKDGLEKLYAKSLIKSVYGLGLILYIKLKGVCGESSRKGYILSDLGRKVLMHLELPR